MASDDISIGRASPRASSGIVFRRVAKSTNSPLEARTPQSHDPQPAMEAYCPIFKERVLDRPRAPPSQRGPAATGAGVPLTPGERAAACHTTPRVDLGMACQKRTYAFCRVLTVGPVVYHRRSLANPRSRRSAHPAWSRARSARALRRSVMRARLSSCPAGQIAASRAQERRAPAPSLGSR